ncbi:MAG: hypothetical protein H6996_04840 [Moraxellaceae bacterium]|nr:hypothetical protein [Moraxellaceae bacterium]MCP5178130.1 hypothetical protein [Moraxellaceae bacterium]
MIKQCLVIIAAAAVGACSSVVSDVVQTKAMPAVLATNNTQICYQQLTQQLTLAIDYPVHISPTVFATTSTIFLEPVALRHPNGVRKDGMLLDKPTQFSLTVNQQQCVLSQVGKEWNRVLTQCLCQELN